MPWIEICPHSLWPTADSSEELRTHEMDAFHINIFLGNKFVIIFFCYGSIINKYRVLLFHTYVVVVVAAVVGGGFLYPVCTVTPPTFASI